MDWAEASPAFLGSNRPMYWATTTVPPVAMAMKKFIMKRLIESTILTAATAPGPEELTIEELMMLRIATIAWSTRSGRNKTVRLLKLKHSPDKFFWISAESLLRALVSIA